MDGIIGDNWVSMMKTSWHWKSRLLHQALVFTADHILGCCLLSDDLVCLSQ